MQNLCLVVHVESVKQSSIQDHSNVKVTYWLSPLGTNIIKKFSAVQTCAPSTFCNFEKGSLVYYCDGVIYKCKQDCKELLSWIFTRPYDSTSKQIYSWLTDKYNSNLVTFEKTIIAAFLNELFTAIQEHNEKNKHCLIDNWQKLFTTQMKAHILLSLSYEIASGSARYGSSSNNINGFLKYLSKIEESKGVDGAFLKYIADWIGNQINYINRKTIESFVEPWKELITKTTNYIRNCVESQEIEKVELLTLLYPPCNNTLERERWKLCCSARFVFREKEFRNSVHCKNIEFIKGDLRLKEPCSSFIPHQKFKRVDMSCEHHINLADIFRQMQKYVRNNEESIVYIFNIGGYINKMIEAYPHLKCTKCGADLHPHFDYSKQSTCYPITVFDCSNKYCDQHGVYINHCVNCMKIIDSRECNTTSICKHHLVKSSENKRVDTSRLCRCCGASWRDIKAYTFCPHCGKYLWRLTEEGVPLPIINDSFEFQHERKIEYDKHVPFCPDRLKKKCDFSPNPFSKICNIDQNSDEQYIPTSYDSIITVP